VKFLFLNGELLTSNTFFARMERDGLIIWNSRMYFD